MPLHDWSLVDENSFHAFHYLWIARLQEALVRGVLPAGYHALPEQRILGGLEPDVLTLERTTRGNGPARPPRGGSPAVMPGPPKFEPAGRYEPSLRRRQRYLAVRKSEGNRLVAVIEVVSRGNKSSRGATEEFVNKAVEFLANGLHLLILDVHPHGTRDPAGLHNLIWQALDDANPALPAEKPLTFASFDAGGGAVCAYIQTTAVGEPLPTVPLFLLPGLCVDLPLEPSYTAAFELMPDESRDLLDPPPA